MTNLPDPEVALARLAPIFPAFYEAIEHGTGVARGLFDEWGFELEGNVFSSITRLHAIPVLDARGRELDGYQRTPLANSGILMAYAGHQLRCWKTTDGELPSPASSATRLRFYRQIPLDLPYPEAPRTGSADGGNLVVLWEYDLATESVELTLVCPKAASDDPNSVEAAWSRPIPRPSAAPRAEPPTASTGHAEDLEFIRRKAPTTEVWSS